MWGNYASLHNFNTFTPFLFVRYYSWWVKIDLIYTPFLRKVKQSSSREDENSTRASLSWCLIGLAVLLCVSASVCVAAGLHCTVHVSDWIASSSRLEDDQLGATGSAREPKPAANKHVRIRALYKHTKIYFKLIRLIFLLNQLRHQRLEQWKQSLPLWRVTVAPATTSLPLQLHLPTQHPSPRSAGKGWFKHTVASPIAHWFPFLCVSPSLSGDNDGYKHIS